MVVVTGHHKALVTQDSKIELANKKLKTAKALIERAEEQVFKAHRRSTVEPNSEQLKTNLERAIRTRGKAEDTYTKAVESSIGTIGTGSGRVMVLLPPTSAYNIERK
jgi:hypothetical protein